MKASMMAGGLLLASMAVLPAGEAMASQGPCGQTYVLEGNDTFYTVAERCKVTLSALMMANPSISNIDSVAPGTELMVPAAVTGLDTTPLEGSRDAEAVAGTRHVVEPGDTFDTIAARYNISVGVLEAANPGIEEADLRPGASLILPPSPAEDGKAPVPRGLSIAEGRLAAGADCPVVTTPAGEIVGLVGNTRGFRNGDYVRVEGELTDRGACSQGSRTIDVATMLAVDPPEGQ
ncbi:LysM peptidoglycan-binding domain-containing protein [Acuticoccus kandeliae]|uniref:LysM peptidoglycan-binding domain-containing protein n=1 Tax=Acuticoccus kandeliae TaxID=2073160 RepID=UPI0014751B2E|nr:LysM peptidoglycan-binding domain-containing protein [Acuticoccus kandeliae]